MTPITILMIIGGILNLGFIIATFTHFTFTGLSAVNIFAPIIMAWGIVTFVIYQKHQK